MVINNTKKNNFILLEVFASVFTVSSYFTDNPRIYEFYDGEGAFVIGLNQMSFLFYFIYLYRIAFQ